MSNDSVLPPRGVPEGFILRAPLGEEEGSLGRSFPAIKKLSQNSGWGPKRGTRLPLPAMNYRSTIQRPSGTPAIWAPWGRLKVDRCFSAGRQSWHDFGYRHSFETVSSSPGKAAHKKTRPVGTAERQW